MAALAPACVIAALQRAAGRLGTALVYLLAAAHAALFAALASLKFQAMRERMPDLAAYDQAVWETLHGRFLHVTVWNQPDNYLGRQVALILAALAPLDLVFHDARVLMASQAIALAVGAVPVLWWASARLGPLAGVAFGLAYLLNPSLAWVNAFPFVHVSYAAPLLGFTLYYLLTGRLRRFWLCLALALLVKEEIAFITLAIGLYAWLALGRRWLGLWVMGVGAAWAVTTLGVILPAFGQGSERVYFVEAYAYLGATPGTIVWGALTHPLVVARHALTADRLRFVAFLLAPWGLLPLLGWRLGALALPTLGYLLLGESAARYDPHYYYAAPLLPILALAAVEGACRLRCVAPRIPGAALALGAAVAGYYGLAAGPATRFHSWQPYQLSEHARLAARMLGQVPPEASVSANTNLIAHLARRRELRLFPDAVLPTDVYALDLRGWDGWRPYPANFDDYGQALRRALADPAYTGYYQADGLALLRRQPPPAPQVPLHAAFGDEIALEGYDLPDLPRPGASLTVVLHWRALARPAHPYTVFLHFGDTTHDKLAQRDEPPWEGLYPTVEWPPGRVVLDPHRLPLPSNLRAGSYLVHVGLYYREGGALTNLRTAEGATFAALAVTTDG